MLADGEAVYSVRQNSGPSSRTGTAATVASRGAWGGTVGGVEDVARGALGEDKAGDLIYAGSMAASPADLAATLVQHKLR